MSDKPYRRLLDDCKTRKDLSVQIDKALRDPIGYVTWQMDMRFSMFPGSRPMSGSGKPNELPAEMTMPLYIDIARAALRIRAEQAIAEEVPRTIPGFLFFGVAIKKKLITENPFDHFGPSVSRPNLGPFTSSRSTALVRRT